MKVIIRVDASLWIGSGHVMRCVVLADAMQNKGYQVQFACIPQVGDLIDFLDARGFDVIRLTSPEPYLIPKHNADYLSWLQRSVNADAQDFTDQVGEVDLIVTDHYAIGSEWQAYVKQRLNCYIVAIDDLVRQHKADLIIDQTLSRKASDYQSDGLVLAGSDYALLSKNFAQQREFAFDRKGINHCPKVLISMGGVDQPNATLQVLLALVDRVEAEFTVLLSDRAPHYQSVVDFCSQHQSVTHINFVTDMASLMLSHDMAIGAPGTTSWERACLGLPSIIIPLADNQKDVAQSLVTHDASICVQLIEINASLLSAYHKLNSNWYTYYRANLGLCDGLGVNRVMYEIGQLVLKSKCEFSLIEAQACHIKLVYQWQCYPKTRQYALNSSSPSWNEHQTWMNNKLKSVEDYFYLIKHKPSDSFVGVLRLDRHEAAHYLVSIFIRPDRYGQGIGYTALTMADAIHRDVTLHATVLPENLASQKLFEKANYRRISQDQFIREPIGWVR